MSTPGVPGVSGVPDAPAAPERRVRRPRPLPMFQKGARQALENPQLRRNLYKATHTIRNKRAAVVGEVPDWQELREAGRAIKERTLRHLDTYLQELEASVQRAGGRVHWARDAEEANTIIARIVAEHGAREVIKVKSLTTDEIRLNEALAAQGIDAIETDLAELIIQLAGERSSHILVPAIHKNRSEIRELFLHELIEHDLVPGPRELLGTGVDELSDEPRALTTVARAYLRNKFLSAQVAISGANFAVAESGTVCVVESEGNGRMCLTLPQVLISVMGIEKVIPTWQDLEVFLQLLPRSSTGERMNPYTSLWTGVSQGDGPREFHLVLLDNGRTQVLADTVGRQALNCIRCSACLNICPVYERTGGHAYASVYPGPIGAILTPQLLGVENASSLPYASSLCGACYEVCPVKINIPEVLIYLRGQVVQHKQESALGRLSPEALAMKVMAQLFSSQMQYEEAQQLARLGQLPFVHRGAITRLPGPLGGWSAMRDLSPVPTQSFRGWWRSRQAARRKIEQPVQEEQP
ncbi:MAG TPA: LutB/LldF family L-lactate oxidation iron-sulfur protein [Ktedonobacteraceae bacterium]|nr:LutB/LldF family L-lactate oxidation iron-sulfur protein [Ktedonobacteraceae bacterium]